MNKISLTMVSLVGMTGLAFAQAKAPEKAPAAPAAPAAGAKDAKAAPTAAAGSGAAKDAKAPAAAPMEMPKPPAEIAAAVKAHAGSWKCTGVAMGGADMKTEMKFKGTMTSKSDLDGWWMHDSMNGMAGEGKAGMKFKMESFSTFDGNSKKWRVVSVMNDGGAMMGTSDGMKDGKMDTTSDSYSMMGTGMFKDHVDMTDAKAGVKMWGEMSMDKGKTFTKVYEMACKK